MSCALLTGFLLSFSNGAWAATVSIFDVVRVTSTLTVVGTTTLQGNEFSVGGTSFSVVNGTVTFAGLLWRNGNSALGANNFTHVNLGRWSTTGELYYDWENNTVGGGVYNGAIRSYSTVGGGYANSAQGIYSTVGGGKSNGATYDYDTVGGGYGAIASGSYSVVSGGNSNWAKGYASVVPGGYQNWALGDYSLAAGQYARAVAKGSFLWADSRTPDIAPTEFVRFFVQMPATTL